MNTRPLLIAGGRLLDPEGELHRPPVSDLLIEDGRIAALGEAARERAAGLGAELLDVTGQLVCPGFVNAHSHSHDALLRGAYEALPLEVWGLTAFPSAWPRRPVTEIRLRTALHAAECLMGGMTTVQDMVSIVGPDSEHAAAVLDAYAESGIRCVLAPQFGDRGLADGVPFLAEEMAPDTFATLPGAIDANPLLRWLEALMDAPTGPRLSWGLGPSAPQRCSEAIWDWVRETAPARGLPVFTHVYETRTQAVLGRHGAHGSLLGWLHRQRVLAPGLVIAHGVWIAPEEIALLAEAGGMLVTNPAANLKLLNGVAPLRAYADAGVPIALGCDNSSAGDAQNIFQSMKSFAQAWSLQSPAGEVGGAETAFRAATLGGARALGLAAKVGRIAPGYHADLVMIDLADPAWLPLHSAVRQLVYAESGRGVRGVVVDGEVVVRDGRLLRQDQGALARDAGAVQDELARDLVTLRTRHASLAESLLRVHRRAAAVPLPFDRLRFA